MGVKNLFYSAMVGFGLVACGPSEEVRQAKLKSEQKMENRFGPFLSNLEQRLDSAADAIPGRYYKTEKPVMDEICMHEEARLRVRNPNASLRRFYDKEYVRFENGQTGNEMQGVVLEVRQNEETTKLHKVQYKNH